MKSGEYVKEKELSFYFRELQGEEELQRFEKNDFPPDTLFAVQFIHNLPFLNRSRMYRKLFCAKSFCSISSTRSSWLIEFGNGCYLQPYAYYFGNRANKALISANGITEKVDRAHITFFVFDLTKIRQSHFFVFQQTATLARVLKCLKYSSFLQDLLFPLHLPTTQIFFAMLGLGVKKIQPLCYHNTNFIEQQEKRDWYNRQQDYLEESLIPALYETIRQTSIEYYMKMKTRL